MQLSNSGVDSIENNVISVCYIDANETQNTVIFIFPGSILVDGFGPEYGHSHPGPWRHRGCLCPPDRPSFFHHLHGGLIYWSRQRGLVRERGWQLIQLSAFFFILWNLDAFLVHLLDDQMEIIKVQRIGLWNVQLTDLHNNHALQRLYYLAKLDHLLCVPAIVFLYLGLKRLVKEQRLNVSEQGQP